MTLGNMRQNGVRRLFVTCQHCVHYAKVNVDAWPDDLAVSFGPRMRCSKCGKLGAMSEIELDRADVPRRILASPLSDARPAICGCFRR